MEWRGKGKHATFSACQTTNPPTFLLPLGGCFEERSSFFSLLKCVPLFFPHPEASINFDGFWVPPEQQASFYPAADTVLSESSNGATIFKRHLLPHFLK